MRLSPLRQITLLTLALLAAALAVEGTSHLLLLALNPNTGPLPRMNRELSGYTLVRSTPTFVHNTYAPNGQPAVTTNRFGFISDEDITIEKPPNTLRVFLLGGSGMIGAGQGRGCYSAIRTFPEGIYAYDVGIAGRLKAYLQQKFPGKRIQVVNAAVYTSQRHQSMVLYPERVSRFDPDIVINMEGFNDLGTIASGYTWEHTEAIWLDEFVRAKARNHAPIRRLKWAQLLDYVEGRHLAPRLRPPGCVQDTYDYAPEAYERARPAFERSSQAYQAALRQYLDILRADDVQFIFVLQPILARGINKELADYERRMQREMGLIDGASVPPALRALAGNQVDMKTMLRMTGRYFLDDYLSDAIKLQVASRRFRFADMNKEIVSVGSDVAFYTDYCHLTLDGNRIVAQRMGDMIVTGGLVG